MFPNELINLPITFEFCDHHSPADHLPSDLLAKNSGILLFVWYSFRRLHTFLRDATFLYKVKYLRLGKVLRRTSSCIQEFLLYGLQDCCFSSKSNVKAKGKLFTLTWT